MKRKHSNLYALKARLNQNITEVNNSENVRWVVNCADYVKTKFAFRQSRCGDWSYKSN